MLHAFFELSPLLAGSLCGLLMLFRSADRRLKPKVIVPVSLAIGTVCAFVVGELNQGLLSALASIAFDSGTAAVGWVVAHLAARRITA